ncbi:MAG: aldehyde ferredoxin oxidoreductase N-terminal domain-containing protein [Humidesulfovibrio sp.]|nr:aldehyde ferredoxin oxidoreductase N-terminal domain-containing protein [Humidesulfovibrio sp.]
MNTILRIDTGAPGGIRTRFDPLGIYAGLGGRALVARMVSSEVPTDCLPLSGANRLVFAPGLLSGTGALPGRLTFGCKSPLTHGLAVASVGGSVSQAIARLGYAAVVIEGQPKQVRKTTAPHAARGLVTVHISKDGVRFLPADDLRGRSAHESARFLRARHGDAVSVIGIGSAGEMRMSSAVISAVDENDCLTRHIGRGGPGAVMGAKGIKAIVIDPCGCQKSPAQHPAAMDLANEAVRQMLLRLRGDLPVERPSLTPRGVTSPVFGCRNCTTSGCPDIFPETGEAASSGQRPDYDASWVYKEICGIDSQAAMAALDALTRQYGLDSTELGFTLRVAMEADIIPVGDAYAASRLLHDIGAGKGLGHLLGAGAVMAAATLGVDSIFAGADAQEEGWGSRRGNDVCSGEQRELSRTLRIAAAVLETFGYCRFVAFTVLEHPEILQSMIEIVNAAFGLRITTADIVALAEDVLRVEADFNRRAHRSDDGDKTPQCGNWPESPYEALFETVRREQEPIHGF